MSAYVTYLFVGRNAERAPLVALCSTPLKMVHKVQCPKKHRLSDGYRVVELVVTLSISDEAGYIAGPKSIRK